ncbi:hypothetical protein [Tabrizicola thermarum]|uniref:hypothetical protein n=1 Tax=Tabrizicola thermarum TaxID=2670345 RepID=UPI000FFB7278|nr:hypothetical protein [Tabrizicola thermarum]
MNPLTIYQTALNVVSDAVLTGDFDRYAAMIDLPYLVHTATADLLVSTRAELRPTFDALSQGLKARGVTHYERVARAADYVSRDRIEGWHHTHMLIDGAPIAYPHSSSHTLVRRGEDWLFSEAQYPAVTAGHWPMTDADLFGHVERGLPLRVAQ